MTTTVSLMCVSSNDPTMEEKIAVQEDYTNIIANDNAGLVFTLMMLIDFLLSDFADYYP